MMLLRFVRRLPRLTQIETLLLRCGSGRSTAYNSRKRLFIGERPAPARRGVYVHEDASFIFELRPAGLAGAPDWIRGTVSGKIRPGVTARTRPQPTVHG